MHLVPASSSGPPRPRARTLRRAGLVTAVVVLLSTPVAGQEYPPSSETLTVSTAVAAPGEPVTISGGGYAPGATVTVTFESTPRVIGVLRADASGRFTAQVVIPPDATPGMHTIRATGTGDDGANRVIAAAIRVIAPPAAAGPGGRATDGGTAGQLPADAGPEIAARGAATGAPPGREVAPGAAPPGLAAQPVPGVADRGGRSTRLGLTGPVAIRALVAAGLVCVVVGTLLTRARRRRLL